MSEEEAISLSDDESEGEGPNIRPPQAGGSHGKKLHKHARQRERDGWRPRHREEGEGKRDRHRRKSGSRSNREARRRDRERERGERGGGGRRGDMRPDTGDLRHRLNRDRYNREGQEDRHGRNRDDRYGVQDVREEGMQGGSSLNKFLRANKHMEESRRDVEARKKRKDIEKEMEKLRAAVKKKRKDEGVRSRSRSRDRHKRRKSESGEESQEEESEEEMVSGDESEEADTEEGSETDAAGSDATTGSQKSEETPDREESEEGELEEEEVVESDSKVRESKSRSRTPVEGRWADKSPSTERTPSRSPTPMRGEDEEMEQDGGESPVRHSRSQSPLESKHDSRSESPAAVQTNHPSSPHVPPPVHLPPTLPPYLPSVHGCRSVAEFQCLNRIEEGTYGVVYRAKDKRTQEIVALKKLKMEREKEGFPITSLREINTLLISQHVNVVTVREIVVGSNMDQIYIVMDFVQHDLKSLMETMRKKNQVFLPGEVKCLMVQLLRAIAHLHDNWILHRDLKSSNLLLSHNGILKVGDFGLAREYGSPLKAYTSIVVTLWYRAPELLLGIKNYSTHIDVWSIGCIFGELLHMEPLFPGKSEGDEVNKIFKLLGTPSERIWPGFRELPGVTKVKFVDYPISHLRDKFPERMLSEAGINLLKALLTFDPRKRISCEAALEVDYFRENPLPIDPSMFPTWPAKSEQEPGDKLKKVSSPKPPSGGHAFKNIKDDDEDRAIRARGFNLLDGVKNQPPIAGWNLKF